MRDGKVVQCEEARVLYEKPRTRFVADFLGKANLIDARPAEGGAETELGRLVLEEPPTWETGHLAIRPENVVLRPEKTGTKRGAHPGERSFLPGGPP